MLKSKNRKLINELAKNLYWMATDEEYWDRSLMVTRVCGIIQQIGRDMDTFFEMDSRYLVTDMIKFRAYRSKLLDVIEIEDRTKRMEELFKFYEWLHDIGMLKDHE